MQDETTTLEGSFSKTIRPIPLILSDTTPPRSELSPSIGLSEFPVLTTLQTHEESRYPPSEQSLGNRIHINIRVIDILCALRTQVVPSMPPPLPCGCNLVKWF